MVVSGPHAATTAQLPGCGRFAIDEFGLTRLAVWLHSERAPPDTESVSESEASVMHHSFGPAGCVYKHTSYDSLSAAGERCAGGQCRRFWRVNDRCGAERVHGAVWRATGLHRSGAATHPHFSRQRATSSGATAARKPPA
jgi:hypothetical protein